MLQQSVLEKLLKKMTPSPILVDIGASASAPSIWDPIAPFSTYIGFDPDSRDFGEKIRGRFGKAFLVDKAVTATNESEIQFYLTKSPYCSSTLVPNTKVLSQYLFADLFQVVTKTTVPAANFTSILQQLQLDRIDWIKIDSQGTDLRLFQSLPNDIKGKVLAADLEPGLIAGYEGEDVFAPLHTAMTEQGFWLSSMPIGGSIRMKPETLEELKQTVNLGDITPQAHIRISPFYCEPRYFRTVESLQERSGSSRELLLLWIFAMLDDQWGFALDVAFAYRKMEPGDELIAILIEEPVHSIRDHAVKIEEERRARLRRPLPSRIKGWIKRSLF